MYKKLANIVLSTLIILTHYQLTTSALHSISRAGDKIDL